MPTSSSLGLSDHRPVRDGGIGPRAVVVQVNGPDADAAPQANRCAAAVSVLTCVLLVASGITVGVWAALEPA
jgi:hypothetical protein